MAIDWNKLITVSDEESVNILCGREILYLSTGGGQDGRGIVSITKTSTSGNVDTYTILYTDYTTSTFTVTNGASSWGQIAGTISDQTDLWRILSGKTDLDIVAETFSVRGVYNKDDCVIYEGGLYRFIENHEAGPWDTDDVEQITIMDGGSGGYIESGRKAKTIGVDEEFSVTYHNGETRDILVQNNAGVYVPDSNSQTYDEHVSVMTMQNFLSESATPDNFHIVVQPYQSGSGTPSSENIRPFVETRFIHLLHSCDMNLITRVQFSATPFVSNGIMPAAINDYIIKLTNMGYGTVSTPDIAEGFWCDLSLPAGSYKLSGADTGNPSTSYANIRIYDEDTNTNIVTHYATDNGPASFTLDSAKPNLKLYVDFYGLQKVGETLTMMEIRPVLKRTVFLGAYQWQQYGGNYVIELHSARDWIVGGTIDLMTSTIVEDKGYIAQYDGRTLPGMWWSDRDVYAEGTLPTIGAKVVYELETPETYDVTIYNNFDPQSLFERYHKFDDWTVSGEPEPTMHYITFKAEYPVFSGLDVVKYNFLPWQDYFDLLISQWDAPQDDNTYGRKNGAWSIAGGDSPDPSHLVYIYVNGTTGNDSNDGSQSQPFKTIKKAIDEAPANQRTWIDVAEGTYSYESSPYNYIYIQNKQAIYFNINGTVIINDHIHIINSNVQFSGMRATLKIYGSLNVGERAHCYGELLTVCVYATDTGTAVKVDDAFMEMHKLYMYADTSYGTGCSVSSLSHVYLYNAYVEAKDGLSAGSGSVIAYYQLTGTMTNRTSASSGAQILTGTQPVLGTMASADDAPSTNSEYVRKNGEWVLPSNKQYSTRTFYVDTINGSDSNNGYSSYPLKTIQKALSYQYNHYSNVEIVIAAGTYNETVSINSPINYKLSTKDGDVIINGLRLDGNTNVVLGYKNSPAHKFIFTDDVRVHGNSCLQVPNIDIAIDNGSADLEVIFGRVSIHGGLSINESELDTCSIAIYALEGSNVYVGNLSANATTVIDCGGSIVSYLNLSGTYTNEKITNGGGRVFTGSQS